MIIGVIINEINIDFGVFQWLFWLELYIFVGFVGDCLIIGVEVVKGRNWFIDVNVLVGGNVLGNGGFNVFCLEGNYIVVYCIGFIGNIVLLLYCFVLIFFLGSKFLFFEVCKSYFIWVDIVVVSFFFNGYIINGYVFFYIYGDKG